MSDFKTEKNTPSTLLIDLNVYMFYMYLRLSLGIFDRTFVNLSVDRHKARKLRFPTVPPNLLVFLPYFIEQI